MGRPKYDKAIRKALRSRIRVLFKEGKDYAAMVPILAEEGFKAPDGGEINKGVVTSQANAVGIRKYRHRRPRKARKAATSHFVDLPSPVRHKSDGEDTLAMIELIVGADFSDSRKISMIRAAIETK